MLLLGSLQRVSPSEPPNTPRERDGRGRYEIPPAAQSGQGAGTQIQHEGNEINRLNLF